MSQVMIELVKSGLDDEDGGGYQGSVYVDNVMLEDADVHPRFLDIGEALAWEADTRARFAAQGGEVRSSLVTRGSFGGDLHECIERWSKMKTPGGEHPVDAEWRATLAPEHPDKKRRKRKRRG